MFPGVMPGLQQHPKLLAGFENCPKQAGHVLRNILALADDGVHGVKRDAQRERQRRLGDVAGRQELRAKDHARVWRRRVCIARCLAERVFGAVHDRNQTSQGTVVSPFPKRAGLG